MDDPTLAAVRAKVQKLQATYQITVTPQVEMILGECMTAILKDPHASWPDPVKKAPSQFQQDMLDALPATLANLATERKLKAVTSFDLLHAMSRLVDHMCPFVKPPP